MAMSKYGAWLTRQPEPGIVHITSPDMTDDCEDDYPVDEWRCRDCNVPLGFYLAGDNGGGWTDCWRIEADGEVLCEDCMEHVTAEVHVAEQPDCDRCGALAGDEHSEACYQQRTNNGGQQ